MKPPRRQWDDLSVEERRRSIATDRRRREAFAPHVADLKRAQRGGYLADFKLFHLVVSVWVTSQREHPRNRASRVIDGAAQQVESERMAELASAGKRLGEQLVKAAMRDDAGTFRKVAETIELLREIPRRGERFKPVEPVDFALLSYFQSHETATIDQLMRWCAKRVRGWELTQRIGRREVKDDSRRRQRDKLIRYRCMKLGLMIVKSKKGPKQS